MFGGGVERQIVAHGAILLGNKPNGGGKLDTPDVAADVH